ncbi:HepT-like ribonuclease domain-containing protein [Agromyces sp. SYSU T00194]|uniref:HepT-like ribonuclease domain-containing protein n=1 Tax=Agromyces chitinivorans TaxID=3158560 RepID=UPI003395E896
MTRTAAQRVDDILVSIERCRRYVDALSAGDASLVQMAEDAIERNLQIIGEAAGHLPAEITDARPEIAWPQIRGFRNILVHRYFGVDVDTVRDVVESYLPSLEASLREHPLE